MRQWREACFWSLQTPPFLRQNLYILLPCWGQETFLGVLNMTLCWRTSPLFLKFGVHDLFWYKDHIKYVDHTQQILLFFFSLLGSSFTISSSQNVWKFLSPVPAIFSSSTKTAELTQPCTQDFSAAIPLSCQYPLLSMSFYWILQTSHKFGQC